MQLTTIMFLSFLIAIPAMADEETCPAASYNSDCAACKALPTAPIWNATTDGMVEKACFMGNREDQSRCTWWATCPAGQYLVLENGTATCQKCSALPDRSKGYYDAPDHYNTYMASYANSDVAPKLATNHESPNDKLNIHPDYQDYLQCAENPTEVYDEFYDEYTETDQCKQCADTQKLSEDKTRCIDCEGEEIRSPNNPHKCFCNAPNTFKKGNQECKQCGANSHGVTSWSKDSAGDPAGDSQNNENCECDPGYYYRVDSCSLWHPDGKPCEPIDKKMEIIYKDKSNETKTIDLGLIEKYKDLTIFPESISQEDIEEIENEAGYKITGWSTKPYYEDQCRNDLKDPLEISTNGTYEWETIRAALVNEKDFVIEPIFRIPTFKLFYTLIDGEEKTIENCNTTSVECKPGEECRIPDISKCYENSFYINDIKGAVKGRYADAWTVYTIDQYGNYKKTETTYKFGDIFNDTIISEDGGIVLVLEMQKCKEGYYCQDGIAIKCPYDTTSEVGATQKSNCYTKEGETTICGEDNTNVCYTLPGNLYIHYKQ